MKILERELASHDWGSLKTFSANSDLLPTVIRSLVSGRSPEEVESAYTAITGGLALSQGRLAQSAEALSSVLSAVLGVCSGASRDATIDVLAEISGGHEDHVDSQMVGPVSWSRCMKDISNNFSLYCEILESEGNASCVDLILMCEVHDLKFREKAIEVYQGVIDSGKYKDLHVLIKNSLDDLE